ncbi:two-component system, unclassified family, sensor histidine kinase and response regulator [Pustulibacterium marinum]|uniref:histidine kinase n=1 Tax=Pustulibacterium marinum TaxID=1224947 RepID=A0A1I7GEI3_9FLAO|nr:hybrid sensor histidine kinase/response regulator [Pustulibacterium marinum]SFU46731.1 two-component system, unclassified family, sensor histidine kinase and response regulator [Pustulibacterium marinum]
MKKPNNLKPLVIAVDDELTNLTLLSFIIKNIELRFMGIQKSTEALELILEQKPNLILLDVGMPEIDGFELCKLIKQEEELKEIPIIFVTGNQRVEDKIKGLEIGGVDYVTKPFNKYELRARILTHLELVEAKAQIKDQAIQLAQDNEVLNRMFSIIGHDLRSPLSAIKMQLDFIIRGYIDIHEPDFMEKVIYNLSSTSDEAFNLLDNLLGWAKSESGVLNIIKEEVDLVTIVKQTVRLQKMAFDNKDIEIELDMPSKACVFADFNTIKTVFVNLVHNAIKFTPIEGKITIKISDVSDTWSVAICDTGVGMTPEQLEKVKDETIHFSERGTENESGTGLGLILCQDFIRKNGSKLIIESTPGEGSTFSYALPKINCQE